MDTAADLARLVGLARSLAITEIELDEHVHDLFDRKAAADWNDGVGEDSPEGCFELHDDYSRKASAINNEGLESQLSCLLDAYGSEETEKMIYESVPA